MSKSIQRRINAKAQRRKETQRKKDGLIFLCVPLRLCVFALIPFFLSPSIAAQDNISADQQFLFAYRLLQKNEQSMAAEALDEYLAKYPASLRSGDARYYRALLYQQQDEHESALSLLENAPSPTLLPAWRVTLLHAQVLTQSKQSAKAIAVLESIKPQTLEDQEQAQVYYELGRLYQERDNLPKAIQSFERCTAIVSPLQSRAFLALGQTQIRFGLSGPALKSLAQASESSDPAVAGLALRLAGDQARITNDWSTAIQSYANLLDQYPDSPYAGSAASGLLTSYTQIQEPQKVTVAYEQWSPKITKEGQAAAHYLAGVAYSQQSQTAKAAAALSKIDDLFQPYPPGDSVLLLLAQNQLATKQHKPLLQTIAKLNTSFPTSKKRIDAAFLKAASQRQTQNEAAASQTLTRILSVDLAPAQQTRALLQRAASYESQKLLTQALDDYIAYFETAPVQDNQPTDTQAATMIRLMHLAHLESNWPLIIGLGKKWAEQYNLKPTVQEDLLYRLGSGAYAGDDSLTADWAMHLFQTHFPSSNKSASAAFYRGLANTKLGDQTKAIEQLERAISFQTLSEAQTIQARRLLVSAYAESKQNDQVAKQLRSLHLIAGDTGLSARDWVWLGQHEQAGAQFDSAIKAYQSALTKNDIDQNLLVFAWYQKARCHQSLKQWDLSVQAFNQVIAQDAAYSLESKLGRANSLRQQGQLNAGLDAYSELWTCRVSIVEAEAFYHAAWIHQQADRPKEAERLLLRLTLLYAQTDLAPWPHRGYLLLFDLQQAAGEQIKAEQALKDLIQAFPDSAQATTAKALLQEQTQSSS